MLSTIRHLRTKICKKRKVAGRVVAETFSFEKVQSVVWIKKNPYSLQPNCILIDGE
jgi:hypothetical protein